VLSRRISCPLFALFRRCCSRAGPRISLSAQSTYIFWTSFRDIPACPCRALMPNVLSCSCKTKSSAMDPQARLWAKAVSTLLRSECDPGPASSCSMYCCTCTCIDPQSQCCKQRRLVGHHDRLSMSDTVGIKCNMVKCNMIASFLFVLRWTAPYLHLRCKRPAPCPMLIQQPVGLVNDWHKLQDRLPASPG
jgi:hypothetical protein